MRSFVESPSTQVAVVHAGMRGRAHALPSDLTLELEQRCVCEREREREGVCE